MRNGRGGRRVGAKGCGLHTRICLCLRVLCASARGLAILGAFAASVSAVAQDAASPPETSPRPATGPLTVAESSDWQRTSRSAEVVAFLDELAVTSRRAKRGELGRTHEGKEIPLLIVADPPVSDAKEAGEAARRGRLVVLLLGNIHSGECDGKEGLLMLARELALGEKHPLLKDLVVVFAPNYNADSNDKWGPIATTRPGQNGPAEAGLRENAQGFDLNRDFVKLEAPETRGLVRFFNEWDPAVFIDCHTTNGSFHRHLVTWAGPKAPAGDAKVIEYVRDAMMPEVAKALEPGMTLFPYGNFAAGHARWETFPAEARYSTNYFGLRGRLGVLCETYSYAPYQDRVIGTRDFVKACLESLAGNREKVRTLLREADERAIAAGREPSPDDAVAIRSKPAFSPQKATALGFVEVQEEGRRRPTEEAKDYEVELNDHFEAESTVARPFAYVIPPHRTSVIEVLQRHGVVIDELREDIEIDAETATVESIVSASRLFQGHALMRTRTHPPAAAVRRLEAGSLLVRTAQKLGNLAVCLLEAESEDGLAVWNFLDEGMNVGSEYPILRIPNATPMLTTRAKDLTAAPAEKKQVTWDAIHGGEAPNFNGSPMGGVRWEDDGDHYVITREERQRRVHAATGRSTVFFDAEPMRRALATIPTINAEAARSLAGRPSWSADRSAAFFEHENDLYFAKADGTVAVRLTATPHREELASFSPDAAFVAFVREDNLYVVDVATQTERALTTDGGGEIRNGKATWVYFEELLGRNWRTFWWSPDSSRIAFLRTDSSAVPRFTLVDDRGEKQVVEIDAYPRPGEPNPTVELKVVTAAGGSPRNVDFSAYGEFLVTCVAWWPDSSAMWVGVQDRTQTWLDVLSVARDAGAPKKLFRETTGAWVDTPRPPNFLKDGSFLHLSERTGWKHLYHYGKDGSLKRAVTEGEWEIRSLNRVAEDAGFVYFSATRDNPVAENFYRARLDGPEFERLTTEPGVHRCDASPGGKYFVDSWSSLDRPTKVALRSGNGAFVRWLDTNPVRDIENYHLPPPERVSIALEDGFVIEGVLVKPPHFDPARKYPVWIETYAGPQAPTVSESWGGARTTDRAYASMGIVRFDVDPRPASGKGAVSAWTAYRQMGVQELKDLEGAVKWLGEQGWADTSRIGISGWSYGGYMAAFALTHSKVFAAGIAGAAPTDWRDYDTIYTERYMGLPQENPVGYDKSSPVKGAKDLHGRLLIVHGMMDDNVHMANAVKLVRALQDAGKEFELMLYPGARHGVGGRHWRDLQKDFILRTMRPDAGSPEPAAPAPSETAAGDEAAPAAPAGP